MSFSFNSCLYVHVCIIASFRMLVQRMLHCNQDTVLVTLSVLSYAIQRQLFWSLDLKLSLNAWHCALSMTFGSR